MATARNINEQRLPVTVSSGNVVAYGNIDDIDPNDPGDAALLASGAMEIVDPNAPVPVPASQRRSVYVQQPYDPLKPPVVLPALAEGQTWVADEDGGIEAGFAGDSGAIASLLSDGQILLKSGGQLTGVPRTDVVPGLSLTLATMQANLLEKADLVNGVIPSSQIPSFSVTKVTPVSSQAAMLALGAVVGEAARRIDTTPTQMWMCVALPSSVIGNWVQLNDGVGVTSVNGQTGGAITLTYTDVGADAAGAAAAVASAAATDATTKANAAKLRSNHSGTQTASTISDFASAARSAVYTVLEASDPGVLPDPAAGGVYPLPFVMPFDGEVVEFQPYLVNPTKTQAAKLALLNGTTPMMNDATKATIVADAHAPAAPVVPSSPTFAKNALIYVKCEQRGAPAQVRPTFVQAAEYGSGSTATSIAITRPSWWVALQTHLFVVHLNGSAAGTEGIATPSGWTKLATQDNGATTHSTRWYMWRDDGASGVTWTGWGANVTARAFEVAFSGSPGTTVADALDVVSSPVTGNDTSSPYTFARPGATPGGNSGVAVTLLNYGTANHASAMGIPSGLTARWNPGGDRFVAATEDLGSSAADTPLAAKSFTLDEGFNANALTVVLAAPDADNTGYGAGLSANLVVKRTA